MTPLVATQDANQFTKGLPPGEAINAAAPPRACARAASPSDAADAEILSELVSIAELEQVADAIENGEPMQGETIRSIIAAHPRIRRLIVSAAVRALSAKKWWWDAKRKKRIEEPDYALSFKAAEFLADRVDGKPTMAVMNLNVAAHGTTDSRSLEAIAESSPAMAEVLGRLVDRLRAKQDKTASI